MHFCDFLANCLRESAVFSRFLCPFFLLRFFCVTLSLIFTAAASFHARFLVLLCVVTFQNSTNNQSTIDNSLVHYQFSTSIFKMSPEESIVLFGLLALFCFTLSYPFLMAFIIIVILFLLFFLRQNGYHNIDEVSNVSNNPFTTTASPKPYSAMSNSMMSTSVTSYSNAIYSGSPSESR